ncbi:MAG: hypothetical protein KBT82_15530, partial [Marinobacter sp.]|uniref:hypothetical protein n=1 Tax=Marinobacter sp. TaxID=50741 RepID=UPI001B61DA84
AAIGTGDYNYVGTRHKKRLRSDQIHYSIGSSPPVGKVARICNGYTITPNLARTRQQRPEAQELQAVNRIGARLCFGSLARSCIYRSSGYLQVEAGAGLVLRF